MIEKIIHETTRKQMPPRRVLKFARLVMVVILTFCFTMLQPSAAATGTNSFTGSATIADGVTFVSTGRLNDSRALHTATLLINGKVLVAGGKGGTIGNVITRASSELYDPAISTWSTTGSMNVARGGQTATLLNDGRVLVTGGFNANGDSLNSAELYDSIAGTWSSTGSMNVARSGQTATLLNNGNVLVAGGCCDGGSSPVYTSAELYDPVTGTWSITGSMNVGRKIHTATLLNNGKVLIAGGYDIGSNPAYASAELYDPVTGTWSTTGSMNVPRSEQTATLLNDGRVLVTGGFSIDIGSIYSAELYDPIAGTWSSTGSMHTS